jgi:hypothetical protein
MRKRVLLSLQPDLYKVYLQFATAQRKPLAGTITDLLVEMRPQVEALTKIQQQVAAGKTSAAKQTLRHMMGESMAAVVAAAQPELFAPRSRK